MDDKYVFANIKLPMKIINNGTKYELFNNRMIIEFEKCDCLPEPTSYENQELISKIFSLHPQSNSSDNAIENDNTIINDDNGENVENNNTVDNSYNNDTESETEKNITIDLPIDDIIKITKNELQYKTPRKRQNISFKKRTSKGQYTRRNY